MFFITTLHHLITTDPNCRVNRTIYLNSLVVDANHQRQGLATKLVKEAVRQCQQSLDINVFVSECTSATSLKILKSAGFEEIYTESYDGNYPGYNWLSRDLQKQYDRLWVVIKRTDQTGGTTKYASSALTFRDRRFWKNALPQES